jgi:hypothetical protein
MEKQGSRAQTKEQDETEVYDFPKSKSEITSSRRQASSKSSEEQSKNFNEDRKCFLKIYQQSG